MNQAEAFFQGLKIETLNQIIWKIKKSTGKDRSRNVGYHKKITIELQE